MDRKKVISLRMERQFLAKRANEEEYIELYRDMQPGLNVYWNGFVSEAADKADGNPVGDFTPN